MISRYLCLSRSGSLAMLAAMRLASSRVQSLRGFSIALITGLQLYSPRSAHSRRANIGCCTLEASRRSVLTAARTSEDRPGPVGVVGVDEDDIGKLAPTSVSP